MSAELLTPSGLHLEKDGAEASSRLDLLTLEEEGRVWTWNRSRRIQGEAVLEQAQAPDMVLETSRIPGVPGEKPPTAPAISGVRGEKYGGRELVVLERIFRNSNAETSLFQIQERFLEKGRMRQTKGKHCKQ